MRGKDDIETNGLAPTGITPAHAGKRSAYDFGVERCQDHPRACGEKTKKIPYYRLFPLRSAPFSFSFA